MPRVWGYRVMANTQARHLEILDAAKKVLVENQIDITKTLGINMLPLAKVVASRTNCHLDTAKRNLATAIRQARGGLPNQWGGKRPGAGRPSNNG